MHVLSDNLKKNGFNVDYLHSSIKRNNNILKFNTLEFYCIYLVLNDMSMKLDGEIKNIESGNAVFLGPARDVEFLSDLADKDIYVIAFTSAFYEKSKKDSIFLNSKVFYSGLSYVVAPYFGSNVYIRTILVERLSFFYKKNESLYNFAAHAVIESLILDALMHTDSNDNSFNDKLNFVSKMNTFNIMLQKDYKDNRTVTYYASKLCISQKKLTEMAMYVLGKTAKQVIIQKIANESIVALRNSDLTISEISLEMGFKCESAFSHFLKKHTGKSPNVIRNVID